MAKIPPKKSFAPIQKKKFESSAPSNFALDKQNYKFIAIGFGIMVLGYLLMIGGGSKNPEVFNADALFSFRRITLSTILIVGGFIFEIYAIMKKPKTTKRPTPDEFI
jgi:membrane-bound ClpP family serine protease